MPEADQNGKSSHAGVKGEFVGKSVPPDGNRQTDKQKTGPDGSGRHPTESDEKPETGTYL